VAYIPTADNIGSMFVGDRPETTVTIYFHDEAGSPASTQGFNAYASTLYSPAGTSVATLATIQHDGHGVHVTFPSTSLLTVPGIYKLVTKFTKTAAQLITAEALQVVVEQVDGWLTMEQARLLWADAPLDDVFLFTLLETAKDQCVAYAPVLAVGAPVPERYTQAQLTQARALYQSTIANQNDQVGIEGFTVRVFPLDFTIRAMLRPKRAIGGMF